jgi:hypothetical protein
MDLRRIKTFGYLISSVSVMLLGIVSWHGLKGQPLMQLLLLLGMLASIAGMFCRWLSYEKQHRDERPSVSGTATSRERRG